MKTLRLIPLLLAASAGLLLAHSGVELGPNGGRILEFSKNETMHGEVTVKDGQFHIAVLDKDMKPVAISRQSLTATTGNRAKPRKLEVSRAAQGFHLPLVKPGEWLILQFKESPDAKPITARFEYDTTTCAACHNAVWLCKCKPE